MGDTTKIEWCDRTWSPWFGCTNVSPACDNCYAEAWAKRSGIVEWGAGKARRRASDDYWKRPLKWNREAAAKGVRIKVFPSLCDPFDAEVDEDWRDDLFSLIVETPHLDWLLLTKRPQVAKKYLAAYTIVPDNMWLGATVENQAMADLRIPVLLSIPARVRFLSCEPLLAPLNLTHMESEVGYFIDALAGEHWHPGAGSISSQTFRGKPRISWVIAGGESGPGARPSHPDWFRSLRDQCAAAGVPFFFKQHGEWIGVPDLRNLPGSSGPGFGAYDHCAYDRDHEALRVGKKAAGATLDGREWREFPRQEETT